MNVNTSRVLRWMPILREYGPYIEYIKGEKNIVADGLSRLTLNGNQETTQKSTYQQEIVSEINDIEELPERSLLNNLILITKYQWLETKIIAKYKNGMYQQGSFRGGSNIDVKLIICKNNILIPSKLQSYLLHWYHTYLLHPGMDRTEAIIRQQLYWPDLIDAVLMELINCDTCQRTT